MKNDVFIGINQKNIMQFNPNPEHKKGVMCKTYTSNPKFTSLAATDEGAFVTGSVHGELRLFKEVGKNAKNLFPGFGDPILGVESSKDGEWLLATAQNYLIIYQTVINNKNGYKVGLGKLKTKPLKLFMDPEVCHGCGIDKVKFTPAKFDNTCEKERYIITTTGRWIVLWDFVSLIKNDDRKCRVFEMKSNVISCEFKHNDANCLIALMEDQIGYIML